MSHPRAPAVLRAFIGVLVLLLSFLTASCGRDNFNITTATTPACTTDQNKLWERVVNHQQGVRGLDHVREEIEMFPAEKFGFLNINNWHPVNGRKETLCGTLHHFNVFDGSGDEMDWNNFVIPSPEFQFLITDVLPLKGGSGTWCVDDNWHDCDGTDNCLEAELTPDETFYNNPWFPKSTGDSVLEGRQICTYGPWIHECVHGHRPEIHPSEQYWWKEKWHDADLWWLMALQDDSNRFDEEDEFDTEDEQSNEWRPWGAAPISSRFMIAFEVNPAGSVLRYEIGEAFAQNVVTKKDADSMEDADNGMQHALVYNGDLVLRANENQERDTDIGVTFTDICRQPGDTLRGFVSLSTRVGVTNDGQEGYHVLFVTGHTEEVRPPVRIPEVATDVIVLTQAKEDSMKPVEIDGRLQLVGELKTKVRAGNRAGKADATIERMEVAAPIHLRDALVFEPDPKGGDGSIKGLRLMESTQMTFETAAGTRTGSTWPGLAVAALIDEQVSGDTVAPASVWPELVKAAGGNVAMPPQGLRVLRVGETKLSAAIQYAMLKDGRVGLEEGSPFVERLNEVLAKGDEKELSAIFGTNQPFKVEWSFEAADIRTGASVQVVKSTGQAVVRGQTAVVVSDVPGKYSNQAVRIAFPEDSNGIYELKATAKITDVFGSTNETEHRMWSHYLADGKRGTIVKPLLPAIAAAAGVPAEDLMAATGYGKLPPNDPRHLDPKVRRALIVYTFALQAVDDSRISVDELTSLITGAKLVGLADEHSH